MAGTNGIEGLRRIVFWYKGLSDAAREHRFEELANPERVKKEADIPAAIDNWLAKLREIDSTRLHKVEPWIKILAIKKIPLSVVEIVNAKDELSGDTDETYQNLLRWVQKWGMHKRLA